MKHVISLGLMTLQIAALAKVGEDSLCETISKVQTMVAYNLDIPTKRVTELFQVVLKDLKQFDCLSEEAKEMISQMKSAEA